MKIWRIPSWLVFIILIVFLLLSLKGCDYNYKLGFVPKEMGVWRIIYTKETDGIDFGPGANPALLAAYALPHSTEDIIRIKGLQYFTEKLNSHHTGYRERGIYEKWQPTPISNDWNTRQYKCECGKQYLTGIAAYLSSSIGGVQISTKIDPDVERDINLSASHSGSFYAYDPPYGLIIVAPPVHKVFYILAK